MADGEETLEHPDDADRFQVARDGDHLMVSFQCDLCHFRNIYGRNPVANHQVDRMALVCIRRANLDAFWSRESSTVRSNRSGFNRLMDIGVGMLGFPDMGPQLGPFPVEDTLGMKIAMCMLVRSLDQGKYGKWIQFSTMRRLRSAYSSAFNASIMTPNEAVLAHEAHRLFSTKCPTYGVWFTRFMQGCHKRMGDHVISDFALSIDILVQINLRLERDWWQTSDLDMRRAVAQLAVFLLYSFCGGLRGEETVKAVLEGTRSLFRTSKEHILYPHSTLVLAGRFKGDTVDRKHHVVIAYDTRSGLTPGGWMERLLEIETSMGRSAGFLLVSNEGIPLRCRDFEEGFVDKLMEVRDGRPDLFEPGLDVSTAYGVSRSCRRGFVTESINKGIPKEVVEMICRWEKVKRSKGRAPALGMYAHYTEARLLLKTIWKASRVL